MVGLTLGQSVRLLSGAVGETFSLCSEEVNTSWVLIIISKVVFTLTVNVVGAFYQNSVKVLLARVWACYPCLLAV